MATPDYAVVLQCKSSHQPTVPNPAVKGLGDARWNVIVQEWVDAAAALVVTAHRRVRKRTAAFLKITSTTEYTASLFFQPQDRPRMPNPVDLKIGKRAWELSVQEWRSALKDLEMRLGAQLVIYADPEVTI